MSESTPIDERRRAVRQVVKSSGMVRAISGQTEATIVQVRDVSELGVGFSAIEPLEVGAVYRFDICDRINRRAGGARAEVRSCRMLAGGAFHVGAQFC